jgi:hypothetical protein
VHMLSVHHAHFSAACFFHTSNCVALRAILPGRIYSGRASRGVPSVVLNH